MFIIWLFILKDCCYILLASFCTGLHHFRSVSSSLHRPSGHSSNKGKENWERKICWWWLHHHSWNIHLSQWTRNSGVFTFMCDHPCRGGYAMPFLPYLLIPYLRPGLKSIPWLISAWWLLPKFRPMLTWVLYSFIW